MHLYIYPQDANSPKKIEDAVKSLGIKGCLTLAAVFEDTHAHAADVADASRLESGTQAIAALADSHLLPDPYMEFVYLFIPFLPFGEPSTRFKIGTVGATV